MSEVKNVSASLSRKNSHSLWESAKQKQANAAREIRVHLFNSNSWLKKIFFLQQAGPKMSHISSQTWMCVSTYNFLGPKSIPFHREHRTQYSVVCGTTLAIEREKKYHVMLCFALLNVFARGLALNCDKKFVNRNKHTGVTSLHSHNSSHAVHHTEIRKRVRSQVNLLSSLK